MNKTQFGNLVRINLLYTNPQGTAKGREKGKTGRALTRYLLAQTMWVALVLLVLYGLLMLPIDFTKNPGMFTRYVGLYLLLGFSQSVSAFQNTFFETRDLDAYLPLPLSLKMIFGAKLTVVLSLVITYLLPLLAIFVMTAVRASYPLVVAILLALVMFVLATAGLLAFSALLVFGLTQTKLFQRFKKTLTTILLVVPMILMVIGVLFINGSSAATHDASAFSVLLPPYWVLIQPLQLHSILTIIGLVAFITVTTLIIVKRAIPKLYASDNSVATQPKTSTPRIVRHGESLTKQLWRYNFSLIKNPALLMKVMSQTILIPMILIISFIANDSVDFRQLSNNFFGVFFVGGIVYSLLSANQASIAANIISLDRDNYAYFLALPISHRKYLRIKFNFSFSIQALTTGLILVIGAILTHVPVFLLGMLLVGDIVGTYLGNAYYFARDYRLRNLTWTNVSQLLNRGGAAKLLLVLMAEIFGGGIIATIYAVLLFTKIINLPVNLGIFAVLLGSAALVAWHYQKNFWQKFVD